jgi:hypothetical protein
MFPPHFHPAPVTGWYRLAGGALAYTGFSFNYSPKDVDKSYSGHR